MVKNKKTEICGEVKEIHYDDVIKKLNLELAFDSIGSPIIVFQDWTKYNDSKDLFRLHIKEAVELKSMIDNLIIDWTLHKIEAVEEDEDDVGYY